MLDVSNYLIQNAVGNYVVFKMSCLTTINFVDASAWNQVIIILFLCVLFVFPLALVWWANSALWNYCRHSQKVTSQWTSVHIYCNHPTMLTTILLIPWRDFLIELITRVDGLFMDGATEVWLIMLVYWVMISRKLVILRSFLRISQLMLYIFTNRRMIISAFLKFRGGLLTTSNLTFLHYKYVIAINQNVGMSL